MRGRIVAGHAALLVVQVCFGLFPIFGTLAFLPGGLSPLGVGSWRLAAGALALGSLAFFAHGRAALPRRDDLFRLLVCGLLGVALNQGLFLVGLAHSTPMNAGLVMTLIPVFTFAIAAAVRQEHFSPVRGVGLLVALAGAWLLLSGQGQGPLQGHGFGNLLMALNGLSYAAYLVISKELVRRYPPLVAIAWVYICALPYLPFFVAGEKLVPDPGHAGAWWSLLYIIAFPTVIAYLLNMFALERVRATTTAVYIYLQPLVAGVASWMVFGERLTTVVAAAALCLFVGIWLVARRPPDPSVVSAKVTPRARA
ncbi:MAG: EamA family transporter [Gemmatimonadota bacterium]|nr:MAG: EamA family transporter [Gemmatimonadota bacterium]